MDFGHSVGYDGNLTRKITMNWASSLYSAIDRHPERVALWTPKGGSVTFAELGSLVRKTQAALRKLNIGIGDHVLLLDLPGPQLYAAAIAIVSMGATILFVEPWMPVSRLNHILKSVNPKVFWSPFLGQLWACRIKEIRRIPHWIRPKSVLKQSDRDPYASVPVPPHHKAILSFSSGTSGQPKGIPRTHSYLLTVTEVIKKFDPETDPKPTIVIFPNLALYHLSQGRTVLLVPPSWPDKVLRQLAQMPEDLAPRTIACGPAFLRKIINTPGFAHLHWIGVGGALLDCDLLQAAIKRFPQVHFELIYGSTEVEPVAHANGREALQKCLEKEFFQIVYLGQHADEITMDQRSDALWVTGPHVTEEYVEAGPADSSLKERDDSGRIWHNMGDRVHVDAEGLWYRGRSFQKAEDFAAEQRLYWLLQSSNCFITRNAKDQPILVGEDLLARKDLILKACPQLRGIFETPIVRDIRHRSRIDRKLSLKPLAKRLEDLPQSLIS
jgi:acyl-CoA synthetase (AMP-forming)/AMP-acid ligase II